MELTSCLGNLSKPGSSNCGNNFSFIWIFLILFLCCGDGLGSIMDCFCGKKKHHHHHHKGGCCNLLGEDNLFILFIVFALFCCNNKGQCC